MQLPLAASLFVLTGTPVSTAPGVRLLRLSDLGSSYSLPVECPTGAPTSMTSSVNKRRI